MDIRSRIALWKRAQGQPSFSSGLQVGLVITSFCFRDWGLLYWTSADVCFTIAVTKEDVQDHFKDGPGTISETKLMSGFGFIEYEDKADASDVVPGKHQSHFSSHLT